MTELTYDAMYYEIGPRYVEKPEYGGDKREIEEEFNMATGYSPHWLRLRNGNYHLLGEDEDGVLWCIIDEEDDFRPDGHYILEGYDEEGTLRCTAEEDDSRADGRYRMVLA